MNVSELWFKAVRFIYTLQAIYDEMDGGLFINGKLQQFIQGVSRLQGITAGGDFLGLCDQKSSYKHVSDFGRLQSYDHLKLRIEGNDY